MGDVVSLKLKRKQKAREFREAEAAENRARFGQSKDEKALAKAKEDLAARALDAHKRDSE